MSPQLGDFSGSVTTPGRPLINLDRSAATCDAASGCSAAWKMVGTGTFDLSGLPSLLWYNAGTNQFGVWQISNIDAQTVVNYKSWSACDASCAAYGIPIGAADINGDGITDILWFESDGSLTVFLQNGSGGYSTRAITQRVPFGFSLVGVRRESDVAIRLVWYNPFSGELQNWNLALRPMTSVLELSLGPVMGASRIGIRWDWFLSSEGASIDLRTAGRLGSVNSRSQGSRLQGNLKSFQSRCSPWRSVIVSTRFCASSAEVIRC
jgi:hypothetical protein